MDYTLSPTELSFWYQYKFDPTSDAQNIVHRLVIAQELTDEQLRQAFSEVLQKHVVLRSHFKEIDGSPYRNIRDGVAFDYTNGDSIEVNEILEIARRPFLLDQDKLVRIIATRNNTSTTLLVTIPHIIFDALSWNIFTAQFIQTIKGGSNEQAVLSPSYPSMQPEAQDYWKTRLHEVDGRVDFERINIQKQSNTTLGTIVRDDESSVFERLAYLGKSEGLSMNTLCMTILSITLSKLTNTSRMIIATPVTTRGEGTENHIGSYINVLPSVLEPSSHSSFLEYAKTAAAKIWDDIENRNLSLIDLLSSMSVQHYDDGLGIYNVMAEYVPMATPDPLIIEDSIVPNNRAKMDVIFSIMADADRHKIYIEYDCSKLEHSYIEKILEVFTHITTSILDSPLRLVRDISLINTQETDTLLALGCGPLKDVTPPYVWNRFKNIALTHANLIAVHDTSGPTTYGQLLALSQRYAGFFIANGISNDTTAGIYMERSVDYVASMLALWSLGAIYVPLDPQQPAARLASMIKQADITAVITKGVNTALSSEVRHYNLEDSGDSTAYESDYEPRGEDTAYIIFTSGSTGTPKGVVIEHAGFLNHLEIMIDNFNLDPHDVISQTAPASFDISVWQLIGAVMVGASLIIVERDDLIDPDRMYRIISDYSVSVLEIVPSLLSGYLSAETSDKQLRGRLENLKIITTGEAISSSIVTQWTDSYPSTPLYNAYGPAEGSDDTHLHIITRDNTDPHQSIPIGRPLQNVYTYIVNHEMHLVPRGIVGEICIGGPVVANGYIGNDEFTSRFFLLDPFSATHERLYRTGDYGRWNGDDTLEYRGRKDHQVKVRGQRLEIGEIEEHLKKMDGVQDAAVIADKVATGTRLIGYIVGQDNTIEVAAVKTYLQSVLPDFMIPQKIEVVTQLPRSNNGKLDRKALEKYKREVRNESTVDEISNHSVTLHHIIDVYTEVLGTTILKDSNYFDCGGDSLQSMRIVSLLEKRHISVGIRDILLYQTPAELAVYVDGQSTEVLENENEWQSLDGFTPMQRVFLENAGVEYRDAGEVQAAVLTLDTAIDIDKDALLSALKTVMKIHGQLAPLETSSPIVIENQWTSGESLGQIIEDIRNRINLESPLVGCMLSENKLLLVAHHFVLDFYSWGVIKSDLNNLLSQPGVTLQYENILSKWWGNAEKNLTAENSNLENAKNFWQPNDQETCALPLPTTKTRHHTHTISLPEPLIRHLNHSAISLESFAYYLYVTANLAINEKPTFSYALESSLRSIDGRNILQRGVGWMTYTFPQQIDRYTEVSTSLSAFHQATTESIRRGYEYGLLRYLICPELFEAEISPVWLLNYLGTTASSTNELELLETTPRKSSAFIEVDIHYNDGQLVFDHYDNINVSNKYFESIDGEMKKKIADLVHEYASTDKVELSTDRSAAILARLNDANRN